MRAHGQTKLGFYPLPPVEANRLRSWLNFQEPFSTLDPCAGDGVAFVHLLRNAPARRYGIEIDAYRAEQARTLEIETLQANTMDVRCPADSLSLLYLNPPYDWEAGSTNNQRLEAVFLDHTYRWLKPGGVLLFVIPLPRLAKCARLLSEEFEDLRVFRLTEPACLQFKQIVVLGTRRKRHTRLADSALLERVRWLEGLTLEPDLEPLAESAEWRYIVPGSGPLVMTHLGISLDELRTCCSIPWPTARRVESFFPNSGMSEAGHSRRCMAATSGCSARRECSTGFSAKEKIATSPTGVP
jgi:SAM-dependent methyltransferase